MEKKRFIFLMDEKVKLVRTEYGLTQEKMAEILGISKKTLVEIEKKRKSLGWTCSVALASIFSDSTVLKDTLGGDSSEIIIAVAFQSQDVEYPRTWGGKVWWHNVVDKDGYRIQQNMVSRHYRLLEVDDRRIYTSFNFEEIERKLAEVIESSVNG